LAVTDYLPAQLRVEHSPRTR